MKKNGHLFQHATFISEYTVAITLDKKTGVNTSNRGRQMPGIESDVKIEENELQDKDSYKFAPFGTKWLRYSIGSRT